MTGMHKTLTFQTNGYTDIVDITDKIQDLINEKNIKSAVVNIFVVGSTAGITAIEADENLCQDFKQVLEEIAPYKKNWKHHQTWGDDNGAAHIRASLVGPSLSLPIIDGKLQCGTWQKIVLIDFDTGPRTRKIIVSIMTEG